MTSDITTIALTVAEEARLTELESIVETGLQTFLVVGNAIAEINSSKLYRATHGDFASYLEDRWAISRSRGYQLIAAAEVSTVVDAAGLPEPRNEAQARVLSLVPKAQVAEVWSETLRATSPRFPTARDIENAPSFPKPPRRERRATPLPDFFFRKLHETRESIDSLTRTVANPRWKTNVDSIRDRNLGDLNRLIDALVEVRDAMVKSNGGAS